MNFQFETTIKETPGAINTAANIAEKLGKSQVIFSRTKDDVPGIWVKFEGEDRSIWIASWKCSKNFQMEQYCEESWSGNWWKCFAMDAKHSHYDRHFLFAHLTNAAKEMVENWIESVITEYESRMDQDAA